MGGGVGRLLRQVLVTLATTAFATLGIASAPSAAAQETLAASCFPTRSHLLAPPGRKYAQIFTPQISGALTRAELDLTPPEGATDPFVIEIRQVTAAGLPSNVILASVTSLSETSSHPASVAFPNPPPVTAGQRYALAFGRTGEFAFGLRSDCPDDLWSSSDGGTTWSGFATSIDAAYGVFVTPFSVLAGAHLVPPERPTCAGKTATMVGTDQNDVLVATGGSDVIVALRGNDRVVGLAGNDLICGGAGKDTLKGGPGKDKLKGGAGKDTLLGQAGKDTLKGGGAKDVCKGGKGNDSGKCEVEKSL